MEVSKIVCIFAAEIPPCMQITWVKPPQGGFIFKEQTMKKKKVIVYVDGYNFYYGLKYGGNKWKRHYWLDMVKFFERIGCFI